MNRSRARSHSRCFALLAPYHSNALDSSRFINSHALLSVIVGRSAARLSILLVRSESHFGKASALFARVWLGIPSQSHALRTPFLMVFESVGLSAFAVLAIVSVALWYGMRFCTNSALTHKTPSALSLRYGTEANATELVQGNNVGHRGREKTRNIARTRLRSGAHRSLPGKTHRATPYRTNRRIRAVA